MASSIGRGRTMKKRIGVAVGISIMLLTAIAVSSQPSLSKPDLETRLRAFGVPQGAEVLALGADGNGELFFAGWRDSSGRVHTKNTAPVPKTDR